MKKGNHAGWELSLNVFTNPKVLGMMFLGFSAGLPYMLVFVNLSTWLTDIRVPLFIVGFFAWISITFSIKVFWAPILDAINIPLLTRWLGHRRSWMLLAQIGIAIGLIGMSSVDPHVNLWLLGWFGFLTAFSAATQDICVDAYRIEAVPTKYQAAMASTYIFGYRFAIVISGAGVLMISEFSNWNNAYYIMALLMSVGMITTLLISEPINRSAMKTMPVELVKERMGSFNVDTQLFLKIIFIAFSIIFSFVIIAIIIIFPVLILALLWALYKYRHTNIKQQLSHWYQGAVIGPIVDFVYRYTFKIAMLALALILVYKVSDLFMAYMANPLYLTVGFSKLDIAVYTKVFGVVMTMLGAFAGGIMVMRYGVMKILLLGAIMVATTNLLFSLLALTGKSIPMLIMLIIGDNTSNGIASVAFIAYMSSLVNKQYTATQYALFTSLMLFLGKFMQGFSGSMAHFLGFPTFFVIASLSGIPAILLILYLMKLKHDPSPAQEQTEENTETVASKSSRLRLASTYLTLMVFIAVIVVFVMFERGIFQFNSPNEKLYAARGLTIAGNKTIKWEKLKAVTWDQQKQQHYKFIYFEVTKGAGQKRSKKQQEKHEKFVRKFKNNWKNASKHGFLIGAAHTFDLCQSGAVQAANFIKHVPKDSKALTPVIQLQLVGNCPVNEQPPNEKIAKEIRNLATQITTYYGKKPILLGNEVAYNVFVKRHFNDYRFWLKSVIKTPNKSSTNFNWLIWQYSARGLINGVSGYAKLNTTNGGNLKILQ